MNQGFWTAKGSGCLNDGEMAYDSSSKIEPKRSHQWFMDGPEADLFPNKKQAVEASSNNLFSGMLNPWANASSFNSISGNFTERLFDSETARTVNFDDRNILSAGTDKVNAARKLNEDPFGSDSLFGLSMSHTLEDPRSGLNFGGIRKVKVSQVKDSENLMPVPIGHSFDRMDNNSISAVDAYDKLDSNSMSTGLAFNKGDDNILTMSESYDRENNIFISMGQPYSKGDDTIAMGTYKGSNSTLPVSHAFSKDDSNIISMGQTYNKTDDNSMVVGHVYSKEDDSTVSLGHTYSRGENNTLSIGQSYSKGESTIISFGGYEDDGPNSSSRLLPNYEFLTGQSSVQKSEVLNQQTLGKSNADALTAPIAVSSTVCKKKEDAKVSKKIPPNNFPSNVRSLLSTGMLDGVPVKYIAWSREELCGVIKGSGYQCGCQSCNFSKVINAYEFERHAGCKTKHPNNHIYFENGKTIYGIVQELRSTPQNMLFEIIQTITGSPINQKSFRLWKESFLAATRELQRIYGNDEGKQLQ
ncbi:uncharacterized protein LOC110807723 isoform X2 [Carica papaya]|uniref:uncharacterized protein LOC110807723 isoform X2 n=1 Tax=Carica papaya TaxID=3649 RepID=UPI000B8C90AE|nr:uncharacterized protein LOC110807723 isoform X2 [Carica papaya]